jgi:hypothetical protein
MASDAQGRRPGARRAALRRLLAYPRSWRAACAVAALASVTLTVVGQWSMYRTVHLDPAAHLWDILYGSLSLFVLQPPPQLPPDVALTAPFQVGRFLAPVASLYALADALEQPLAQVRASLARGHTVVCGDGPGALAVVAKLRQDGDRVVLVADAAHAALVELVGDPGVAVVAGDPTRRAALHAARLHRAARLYVLGAGTGRNLTVLAAANEIAARSRRHRTRPLHCHVAESDADLLDALWILQLRHPVAGDRVEVAFFNPDRLGARVLLDALAPPATSPSAPPPALPSSWSPRDDVPIVVAGMSSFGRELLVEIARRRGRQRPDGGARLPVVVVGQRASATVERLRARYEVLDTWLDLDCHDVPADEVDLDRQQHARAAAAGFVEQIFVCYADEEVALRLALATARPQNRRSVVVRVDRTSPLSEALRPDRIGGQGPMDLLYDAMVIFPQLDRACDPKDAPGDWLDAWAEAIHADYCRQRMAAGETSEANEALVAWENLPDRYRSNNYDQARDIRAKLDWIDCVITQTPTVAPFAFTATEVDQLSRWEHERWMRNRLTEGWTYGPVRDNIRKLHPDLVDYDLLTTETKAKDEQMVRLIPGLLASAGYRIARSTTPAAA